MKNGHPQQGHLRGLGEDSSSLKRRGGVPFWCGEGLSHYRVWRFQMIWELFNYPMKLLPLPFP